MATLIGGFKDRKIETRTKVEPSTVQPLGRNRMAVDTMAQVAYEWVGADSVEAGSTTTTIVATGHVARVGDVIRFTSGVLVRDGATVSEVAANSITLSQTLISAPAVGVGFEILTPNVLRTISNSLQVSGAVSVDGSFVGINDISNIVGQTNSANSIPVVLATNQSAIPVTLPNASGAAPSFATVGTTSASVGLSTATYQKLIFCNTSVNTIALSFNGAAVASRGIVLAPGEKVLLDGPISVTTVNAIASAASSNLAIQAFT